MILFRPLTEADLSFGMSLTTQAGWNTTEADWRRWLALQPDGGFVAELDGTTVGTVTTCVFGPVAWIALVLVDANVRGRGVGTALMHFALAFLKRQGVRSVRLDATQLGRPVYEKLGFVAQFEIHRYHGIMPPGESVVGVETARPDEYEELLILDRTVTCTDRRKLLTWLFTDQPTATRLVRREALQGFIRARFGANAIQVGPCLATTAEAARLLLADARHRFAGRPMFIDVPIQHREAIRAVEELGLTIQRPLLRMCRGEPVIEKLEDLWASSGPEKG